MKYDEYNEYPALKNLMTMIENEKSFSKSFSKRRSLTKYIVKYNTLIKNLKKSDVPVEDKLFLLNLIRNDFIQLKFVSDFSLIQKTHLQNYITAKYRREYKLLHEKRKIERKQYLKHVRKLNQELNKNNK